MFLEGSLAVLQHGVYSTLHSLVKFLVIWCKFTCGRGQRKREKKGLKMHRTIFQFRIQGYDAHAIPNPDRRRQRDLCVEDARESPQRALLLE